MTVTFKAPQADEVGPVLGPDGVDLGVEPLCEDGVGPDVWLFGAIVEPAGEESMDPVVRLFVEAVESVGENVLVIVVRLFVVAVETELIGDWVLADDALPLALGVVLACVCVVAAAVIVDRALADAALGLAVGVVLACVGVVAAAAWLTNTTRHISAQTAIHLAKGGSIFASSPWPPATLG